MPLKIESPTPTTRQLSGNDPAGAPILSVVTRMTYLLKGSRLELALEQLPLAEDAAEAPGGRLAADLDLYPFKPATDIVLLGHAHGKGRKQFDVNVSLNDKLIKKIRVIGNREVAALGGAEMLFGPPAPVEKVPLTYEFAYGGTDGAAEKKHGNPWADLAKYHDDGTYDAGADNPFRYPRNPAGKGYLIEATVDAINAVTLPNLEDPLDLLTPERLVARQHGWWYKMPLPQATEWLPYGFFPRICYFGFPIGHFGELGKVAEIERGFAPKEIMELRPPTPADAFRFTNGASLGMTVPHLQGGETITVENVHPTLPKFTFTLPTKPKIQVDGRKGTMKETKPVLHSVLVEPDLDRVTLLWRGSAPALRPYLPEELQKMPLKVEWM